MSDYEVNYKLRKNFTTDAQEALYEILEERYYDNLSNCKEDLDRLESYYIGKYDSFNNGYNSTLGGDGNVGYKISDSTK